MKRILIVEDEAAIREFEAINLKRVGYETVEAGSGEEALEIYDSDTLGFDIALLDIMMINKNIRFLMIMMKSSKKYNSIKKVILVI